MRNDAMLSSPLPRRLLLSLAAFFALVAPARAAEEPPPDAAGVEFFEKRVRPLLADRCYRCHSDRATKLRGGLRLDTREGLLKGGNSGPAVVPGDPDRSLLIRAVRHADPDLKMPPSNRLPAEEVATLEAWVKRGAPVPDTGRAKESSTRTHWAFLPPKAERIPPQPGSCK